VAGELLDAPAGALAEFSILKAATARSDDRVTLGQKAFVRQVVQRRNSLWRAESPDAPKTTNVWGGGGASAIALLGPMATKGRHELRRILACNRNVTHPDSSQISAAFNHARTRIGRDPPSSCELAHPSFPRALNPRMGGRGPGRRPRNTRDPLPALGAEPSRGRIVVRPASCQRKHFGGRRLRRCQRPTQRPTRSNEHASQLLRCVRKRATARSTRSAGKPCTCRDIEIP